MEITNKKKIAIFASGNGSNALSILRYFHSHSRVQVLAIISNNENAGVLNIAKSYQIPTYIIPRKEFEAPSFKLTDFCSTKFDLIVLAGFLVLIPATLIAQYPNKILNIHPSLLPRFGGAGMYGKHVHQAVIRAAEQESGMTIHLVNEDFDKGKILLQKSCKIEATDTPERLSEKVLLLEHQYYAPLIESFLLAEG
jgi:phosphoribosylglycinamide formyltransferase-1